MAARLARDLGCGPTSLLRRCRWRRCRWRAGPGWSVPSRSASSSADQRERRAPPAIALTAQSADEAGDDFARGPCEMPGDAAGQDDRRVGQQGRRTHRNRLCRAAGAEQRREAGGAGRGAGRARCARTVVSGRRGSDRTGRQLHYRDMESGASEAASALARRPARSGSDIPPPPSTAQGCSSIPPPPVTALASCSPIPPAR